MCCWGELKSLRAEVLVRSVCIGHGCSFQDVWKWKSARPTVVEKMAMPLME